VQLLQVWLALEYKGISYDTMLIDLQNKPEWYSNIAPTKLVPAVRVNGEVVYESYDILKV
jgi:glutathione S-transferase